MSDFRIQRGTLLGMGATGTLLAGIDYIPPRSLSRAFIRITGVGRDNQVNNTCVYITDPGNLLTSVTLERATGGSNTAVNWEIIEYVGPSGGPNEMIVRNQEVISVASGDTVSNGTVLGTVVDDDDVMTLVTGAGGVSTTEGERVWHTSAWDAGNQRPQITRGESGVAMNVSLVVVEWTGPNWTLSDIDVAYSTARTAQNVGVSVDRASTFLFDELRFSGVVGNVAPIDWMRTVTLTSDTNLQVFFGNGDASVDATVHVYLLENTDANNPPSVERVSGSITGATDPWTATITDALTNPQGTSLALWATVDRSSAGTENSAAGSEESTMEWIRPTSTTNIIGERITTGSDPIAYVLEVQKWPGQGVVSDFKVQQFFMPIASQSVDTSITGAGITGTAGVHYEAPASASAAFLRIVSSSFGRNTDLGPASGQDAPNRDGWVVFDQSDLTASFNLRSFFDNFSVFPGTNARFVLCEIVEYVGDPGGDNEMVVRGEGVVNLGTGAGGNTGDSATISGVIDDNDVVVWATGQIYNQSFFGGRINSYLGSWEWVGGGTDVARVSRQGAVYPAYYSFVVVEFVGSNWTVQREENSPASAATAEDVTISSVGGANRAFVHNQMRCGAGSQNNPEVVMWQGWITSATNLRIWAYDLAAAANAIIVSWIVSNADPSNPMEVEQLELAVAASASPQGQRQYTDSPASDDGLAYVSVLAELVTDSADTSLVAQDLNFFATQSGDDIVYYGLNDRAYDLLFRTQRIVWPGELQFDAGATPAVGRAGLVNAGLVETGLINSSLARA